MGNGGVVPKWLEFDTVTKTFYVWLVGDLRPSSANGNYQIIGDSLIELNVTEYDEKSILLIDSISENYLKIIPMGISAGSLVYNKAIYEETIALIERRGNITGEGTLLSIEESDFTISIDEDKDESTIETFFLGEWNKENMENPIDPKTFVISKNKDHVYSINFGDDISLNLPILNTKIVKGVNALGNYTLELISTSPPIISYSDDGRGHFNPVINEKFMKKDSSR